MRRCTPKSQYIPQLGGASDCSPIISLPARVKVLVASVMQPSAEYLLGARQLRVQRVPPPRSSVFPVLRLPPPVQPDREIDGAYLGGERHGAIPGRGAPNKGVVGAGECRLQVVQVRVDCPEFGMPSDSPSTRTATSLKCSTCSTVDSICALSSPVWFKPPAAPGRTRCAPFWLKLPSP